MIKYTNPELIGIGERRGRGEINRWSFCATCSNSDVCNIQDTVCLPVAREHPLSLLLKDIQTVCSYESDFEEAEKVMPAVVNPIPMR